jgi:hypothetical protein
MLSDRQEEASRRIFAAFHCEDKVLRLNTKCPDYWQATSLDNRNMVKQRLPEGEQQWSQLPSIVFRKQTELQIQHRLNVTLILRPEAPDCLPGRSGTCINIVTRATVLSH